MTNKLNLSLCLINKDDEKNLNELLHNASKYIEEIIVVDTGSVDKSVNVAKQYTDKVFEFKSNKPYFSFADARNYSYLFATTPWIMYLDTDDDLSSWEGFVQDFSAFEEHKEKSKTENLTLQMEYHYGWNADHTECLQKIPVHYRIVENNNKWRWSMPIHENLSCDESYTTHISNIDVIHKSQGARGASKTALNGRNSKILEAWLNDGAEEKYLARIYHYLGNDLCVNKQHSEARKYLEKSLFYAETIKESFDPFIAETVLNLSTMLYNERKYSEVVEFLLKYEKREIDWWRQEHKLILAYAYYYTTGNKEECERRVQKASTMKWTYKIFH